jgi:aspartate-semialdehyde dehydrogenase
LAEVTASTYQAISGAGAAVLDDFLERSRDGYARADRLGESLSADAYAGNTVPHAGKTDESGFSAEERKLVDESRKILDLSVLPICAQCCRVPVAVGHYVNVWVTFERPTNVAAIEDILSDGERTPFVRLFKGSAGEGLSALACLQHRDHALVGRVRADCRAPTARRFCFTVTADNLRLGAATNAVRIATRWFASHGSELSARP